MTTVNTENATVDVNALLARVAELEAEVAAADATTVTLDEYNGHSVVKFSGNFRPFSLGFGKIRRVLEMQDKLRAMMAQQENS